MVTESRAGGRDDWRVFGFVECLFLRWHVLLGDDVVDGLLHYRYFFIYL